jgi:Flp pilus assembly protein TadG
MKASDNSAEKGVGNTIVNSMRAVRSFFRRIGKHGAKHACHRRHFTSDEGSALVEFALTVPLLFTFFFGLIEVSMAIYTHQVISETAREGTRYAMVHGSTCLNGSGNSCTVTASNVNSYVAAIPWPNIGGGTTTINTTYPDGNEAPGSRVQVTITYAFPFRVPFIPTSTLTMSSTSVMYIIQ